jgi:hypothetical protein
MATRPPPFCPPRPRHLSSGSSVPVDLTSIDVDEYHVGLNPGPRGDDNEDLGTTDLFGVVDGDDGIRMAMPISTTSTATATVMPGATATAMPTPAQGPGQMSNILIFETATITNCN